MVSNKHLLEVNNLSLSIKTKSGDVYPVDDLDINITVGETLALIGESGCGKSMTANAITQLIPPNAYYSKNSKINLCGDDLLLKSEHQMRNIRGDDIAMIFQDPMTALNPVLKIGTQLLEIFKIKAKRNNKSSIQKNDYKQSAINALKEVGLPDPMRQFEAYPHQLSGGMRQRVVIAMALAAQPKLLIADEPTTALDVTIQLQILWLLKNLQKKYNMSLILITHDLGIVSQVADNVAVMYAGHVVEYGSKQQIVNDAKHPYTKMLLLAQPEYDKRDSKLATIKGFVPSLRKKFSLCRFVERCPIASSHCHKENPEIKLINSAGSAPHRVRCWNYQEACHISNITDRVSTNEELKANNSDNIMLAIRNLKVYFPIKKGILKRNVGFVKAADDLSFNIKFGETLALVGESGSGKTTTAKAIVKLLNYQGSIDYSGDIIQIIFQDPYSAFNPKMMVYQILQEGVKAIYHKELTEVELIELLNTVGLAEDALYKYPHEFSGGQRQRIAIARALAVRPQLLILDEPTSALDLSVQAQILNLLKDLQIKYKLSYLLITHDLSVVSYMADNVAVMYLGRIVETGPVAALVKNPKHPYSRSLLESVPDINKVIDLENSVIKGEMPSLTSLPKGCYFKNRCPHAMPVCAQQYPKESSIHDSHKVNCYLYE